jgi:uncharacterized protein YjiS (DUF1127 family)
MKLWFKRLFVKFTEYQQKRADYMILQMMSEKELRDIGINRCELRATIYGYDQGRKTDA